MWPSRLRDGGKASAVEDARGRKDAALALLDAVQGQLLPALRHLVDAQRAFQHERKVRALRSARYEHLPVLQALLDRLRAKRVAETRGEGGDEREALLDQIVHAGDSITRPTLDARGRPCKNRAVLPNERRERASGDRSPKVQAADRHTGR